MNVGSAAGVAAKQLVDGTAATDLPPAHPRATRHAPR
jgi:hypothetical protein